jgi:hypothetical protein
LVSLKAYDNSLNVLDNVANGIYPPPAGFQGVPTWGLPDVNATPIDHDNDPITPDRIPTNYNGTGVGGTWSVVNTSGLCSGNYSFSNPNSPTSDFTADAGTYTVRWTLDNGCYDDIQVVINNCNNIDFDGVNDYITFKDNYDRTGPFSIEMWIKAGDLTGTQSLLSKRDANNLLTGYDLRLNGASVEFRWGTNNSISSNDIDATTWHHIAGTFNGTTYKLYIDGLEKASQNGAAPTANDMECILGAMDQANNPPNKPVDYYHGWIDELRIWNKALDVEHIRQMMNQEIKNSPVGSDDVMGEIIPLKIHGPDAAQDGTDDDPLRWSDLDGYYRMGVQCGYLTPSKGSLNGRLRNINSPQEETAPLPYVSANNGLWETNNTWEQPVVWYTPNSTVFGAKIDWNIVHIKNNVESGNNDLTVLGLLVDTGSELTIQDPAAPYNETNDGQGLWVTHYLKLDGVIDLVGESQLVQKKYGDYYDIFDIPFTDTSQFNESILDGTIDGYIERDQQGTSNLFNYNYWSSPVHPRSATNMNLPLTNNNIPFYIKWQHRDGSDSNNPKIINWKGGYDGSAATSPISIAEYWLWSYENFVTNTYANWAKLYSTTPVKPGLGYTMKGSGASTVEQNYVFFGKPYNNTITVPIFDNNDALVGNPYPCALDANQFLKDNGPDGSNVISGALYFWEHYPGNNTHILRDYLGGYAVLNYLGGIAAVTPPPTADGIKIIGGDGTKVPERYIPVGQGFFVTAAGDGNGGDIVFNNNQRVFKKEAVTGLSNSGSVFFKPGTGKDKKDNVSNNNPTEKTTDDIKRLRIDFKTPEGAIRQLLLGFVPNNRATDGVDYGYDAPKYNIFPNDLTWLIDEKRYEIQGVGEFDEAKLLPLGLFLTKGGGIEISLNAMEGFTPSTKVYVYDALLRTYTKINEKSFNILLETGDYLNRFNITFSKNNSLSTEDDQLSNIGLNYLQSSKEIFIKTANDITVKQVYLLNILGQTIKTWNATNSASFSSNEIKLPVKGVSEGSYIIQVETSKGSTNKKIVIID